MPSSRGAAPNISPHAKQPATHSSLAHRCDQQGLTAAKLTKNKSARQMALDGPRLSHATTQKNDTLTKTKKRMPCCIPKEQCSTQAHERRQAGRMSGSTWLRLLHAAHRAHYSAACPAHCHPQSWGLRTRESPRQAGRHQSHTPVILHTTRSSTHPACGWHFANRQAAHSHTQHAPPLTSPHTHALGAQPVPPEARRAENVSQSRNRHTPLVT